MTNATLLKKINNLISNDLKYFGAIIQLSNNAWDIDIYMHQRDGELKKIIQDLSDEGKKWQTNAPNNLSIYELFFFISCAALTLGGLLSQVDRSKEENISYLRVASNLLFWGCIFLIDSACVSTYLGRTMQLEFGQKLAIDPLQVLEKPWQGFIASIDPDFKLLLDLQELFVEYNKVADNVANKLNENNKRDANQVLTKELSAHKLLLFTNKKINKQFSLLEKSQQTQITPKRKFS